MFSRVIPSWEQIRNWHQPLTEGELYLLQFLDENLERDDFIQGNDLTEYKGWLIFVQPYLNGCRPDIIIFHPHIGVQIFEVKDWNLFNYFFQNGRFYVSDGRGAYPKKSPVRQVEYYKEKIAEQLIPQIGESIDSNPLQYGLIKTAIYFHKSTTAEVQATFRGQQYTKFPLIGYDGLVEGNLNAVVPDSYLRQSKYWRREWNKQILFWLQPPFHAIEQSTFLTFIADQRKFAEPRSGHHRVRGVAGSGKTQVLAYRASALASLKKRVLVLTYNKTLCHYVHDMVQRSPYAFHWRYLTITHFHGFCKDILNQFGEEWPKDEEDEDDESLFREVVPNKVLATIMGNEYERYDAILVDEGQDFNAEWYNMLCHFLTDRDEVVVVCDKKQNIYGRELEWLDKRVGKRVDGRSRVDKFGEWIELKKIIRLPEQVARLTKEFSEKFNLNQDLGVVSVEKPDLFNQFLDHVVWWNICESDTWLDKVDKAFEMIRNQATYTHPSDTVILLPNRRSGRECVQYFKEIKQVEVNHVFDNRHKKAFWIGDSRLKMSTIHSFKGWEAQNVIVVIPSYFQGTDEIDDMIVYTAMTRSRENLIIINANIKYREFGESYPDEWR